LTFIGTLFQQLIVLIMSRKRRAIQGTLTSFLQYGFQIILQFALVPIIIRFAGNETLGSYAVIVQALGYLTLFDLGFSITLARYLAQAMGFDDSYARLTEVIVTARAFFAVISILYCLGALVLAFHIGSILHLDAKLARQAEIGVLLLAAWALLRAPISVYSAALVATQHLATRNIIGIFSNIVRLGGSIYLVWINWGLLGLLIANFVAEAADLTCCWIAFRVQFPQVRPRTIFPQTRLLMEMLKFSGQGMLVNVGVRLVFFTDNIVVGWLFGAAAAGIYFSTQTPAAVGWNLIMRLTDNATPGINELHSRGVSIRVRELFFALHRYTFSFSFPFAVGVCLLNGAAISLWVGPAQYGGSLITWSLAIFACLMCASHVDAAFIVAVGNITTLSIFALGEGVLNLGLSILLGRHIGLGGVMLATVIANIPATLYSQIRAQHDFKIGYREFLWKAVMPPALASVFSLIALLLLRQFIPPTSWLKFGVISVMFLAVHACATFAFALVPTERDAIHRFANRVLKLTGISAT
jgi:O-antigen/teichoic acid export membrane protein